MSNDLHGDLHGDRPGDPARPPEPPAPADAPDREGDVPEVPAAAAATGATRSLLRSSAVMAAGTVVSRVTGFLKVAVIGAALGSGPLSNAYLTANNAPNSVYELLLGGILSAVLVPLFVRADKRDRVEGERYAQRLLTLVALVLLVLTGLSVIGAPLVLDVIAHGVVGDQRAIAIAFLRYFLPQMLFLGTGAVLIAILQARQRFAAPMWAPVLNNLAVIGVGVLFLVTTQGQPTPGTITPRETVLLGVGTTAGIVLQTVALVPSLLKAGFRPRPRFGFRQLGLNQIGRVGLWTVLYVAVNLAGLFVVTNIGGAIDTAVRHDPLGVNYGYTPYQYAFTVFSLPHAIVAVSVITALLPRMSAHAADGRYALIRDDVSNGIRLAAALIVPAAAALVALGAPIGRALFAHGNFHVADADYTGVVLAAFALGLVPFSAFQLLLRASYALQDTRTPALINIAGTAVTALGGLVCFAVLRGQNVRYVMIALALLYGLGYLVNTLLLARSLSRRLGGLDGRKVLGTLLRMVAAAIPGAVLAGLLATGVRHVAGPGFVPSAVAVVAGGLVVLGVFLVVARLLRVAEVRTLLTTLVRR